MLSLFILSALSLPSPRRKPENTYCVCEGDNCSVICRNIQLIDSFSPGKIYNAIKDKEPEELLYFLIANSGEKEEDMPHFNLTKFQHRSFVVEPLNILDRQSIVLRPGHVDHGLFHSFRNVNLVLESNGVYDFYDLKLRNTAVKCANNADITFEQDIIDTDFESLHNMPIAIFDPPTLGATLNLNRTVSDIEFWGDHTLVFTSTNRTSKEQTDISFTFSQIRKVGNSTIRLNSPKVNFTFHSYPENAEFFPKIAIELHRTTQFYFDFPADGDFHESMNLEDRITIKHGSHGVFINSNQGTMAPTFSHEGSGPFLRNNKPIVYHDTYCLCNNETLGNDKCTESCGTTPYVPYSEIEYTVIGNPKESIKYYITGSSDQHRNLPNSQIHTDMPLFNIEHFKDKNITVYGMTKNEHIRIIGDTTDDPDDKYGFHKFSSLTIHTADTFSFPAVALYSVNFTFDADAASKANQTGELGYFNCTRLEIDIGSLHNLNEKHYPIIPPLYSSEIHTTNMIKKELVVKVLNSSFVIVDEIPVPIRQHTLLKIFCGGTMNFEVDKDFSNKVSDFPKLDFVLEGDQNTINFVGTWPKSLETLTSKVAAEHGENPLYSNGDYDGTQYKFIPPVIAHEGSGAYFVNGLLTNYHSHYCICQGSFCQEQCSKYAEDAPIIGFSEKAISATAKGNPTRMIEYTVFGTGEAFDKRPFFGLHDYTYRSFMITTGDSEKKEYIAIEGALEDFESTSSVSHIFENLNIMLANPGYYVFNNIEFSNCELSKHIPAEGEPPSPYENKEKTNNKESAKLLAGKKFYFQQNGMKSDMSTLQSLQSNGLLTPCSLYLTVEGGTQLYQISVIDEDTVKIYGSQDDHSQDEESAVQNSEYETEITLNVGDLSEGAATFNVERKTSYEYPFIVHWNADGNIKDAYHFPHLRIDVSRSPFSEAYVQFDGRKWTEKFHNLTSRLTIVYGLIDVHVMTKVKDLENSIFSGQPPHVNLVGDADYYINDVKQVSLNAPGDHSTPEDDDDDKTTTKNTIVIFGIIIVGFLLALFIFINTPKSNEEMMPAMRIIKEHDNEEDDQITPIVNPAEYNGEKPNFKVIS